LISVKLRFNRPGTRPETGGGPGGFGGILNRISAALLTAISLLICSASTNLSAASAGESSYPAFNSLNSLIGPAIPEVLLPPPAPVRSYGKQLSGEQLFQELHQTAAVAKLPAPPYKQAKAYMFSTADNVSCNGAPGLLTFYSQICAAGSSSNGNDYYEMGDQNGDGVVDTFVNVEHIWPQAFFKSALPMVSDLHQLAPAFPTPNARRANFRFARVAHPVYSTLSGSKLGSEEFEPADAVKGNVARAVLYFVVRYYDKSIRNGVDYPDFWASRVEMFLEWNRQDPPDENERRRNGLIQAFQGNRNPFIDDPSLADQIGETVFKSH
jgi:hypothetical protein